MKPIFQKLNKWAFGWASDFEVQLPSILSCSLCPYFTPILSHSCGPSIWEDSSRRHHNSMMGHEKEHSLSGFPELQIHKTALFSPLLFPKQTLLLSEKNRITISKWRIRPPTEKPWYLPGFLVVASFPLAGPINYFFLNLVHKLRWLMIRDRWRVKCLSHYSIIFKR